MSVCGFVICRCLCASLWCALASFSGVLVSVFGVAVCVLGPVCGVVVLPFPSLPSPPFHSLPSHSILVIYGEKLQVQYLAIPEEGVREDEGRGNGGEGKGEGGRRKVKGVIG